MGFVDDGQRDTEAQPLQVADFFGQSDDLWEEVDLKLEHVSRASTGTSALDCKDASGHAKVTLLNLI